MAPGTQKALKYFPDFIPVQVQYLKWETLHSKRAESSKCLRIRLSSVFLKDDEEI